jgi:hypothetical protein
VSAPWWAALGPAQAQVSCGEGTHTLRWEDGSLTAADHPDAEGELVLAALGGEATPCLDVVRAWGRHSDDLSVLALGPRSAADRLTLTTELLDELAPQLGGSLGVVIGLRRGVSYAAPRRLTHGWTGYAPMRAGPGAARLMAARRAAVRRSFVAHHLLGDDDSDDDRTTLLRLLALGEPFQWRLSGAVAHAWSADGEHAGTRDRARPALTAALTGRLAPAVAVWLDVDPASVSATVYDHADWGELAVSSPGGVSQVRARLPVSWLATVWAPGLSVVEGHLVVRVLAAAWPDAQVLALRTPASAPAELKVRNDKEHWSIAAS